MTFDVSAAGLFAQVIPALLVILALEDRLSPAKIPRRKWRRRLFGWRESAVLVNLASLGLCLVVVVVRFENALIGVIVLASVLYLLCVLALLLAGMFGREEDEHLASEGASISGR
jgi:hypothetical protein